MHFLPVRIEPPNLCGSVLLLGRYGIIFRVFGANEATCRGFTRLCGPARTAAPKAEIQAALTNSMWPLILVLASARNPSLSQFRGWNLPSTWALVRKYLFFCARKAVVVRCNDTISGAGRLILPTKNLKNECFTRPLGRACPPFR